MAAKTRFLKLSSIKLVFIIDKSDQNLQNTPERRL